MLSVDKKTGEVVVTPYSKFMHETVGFDTGSMIIQNYDFSWDNDLRDFIVVEADKEDRQAYIDSFADECGVYNVLKKYAITGDASLLNARQGFYGDISELPVDELDPAGLAAKAEKSVDALSKLLGEEVTSEDLSQMSIEQLNSLIEKAVAARVEKSAPEKKEGEENA